MKITPPIKNKEAAALCGIEPDTLNMWARESLKTGGYKDINGTLVPMVFFGSGSGHRRTWPTETIQAIRDAMQVRPTVQPAPRRRKTSTPNLNTKPGMPE